jgi:hypothetical protein
MARDKLTGSWATVGIIIEKGLTRRSAQGKDFMVLKLGTLDRSSVSLFLFGASYTEYSKEPLGSVVAILSANVRPDAKVRSLWPFKTTVRDFETLNHLKFATVLNLPCSFVSLR